ncbi:MAG: SPFH domain-containing protein [Patescibacteria group bacterium]
MEEKKDVKIERLKKEEKEIEELKKKFRLARKIFFVISIAMLVFSFTISYSFFALFLVFLFSAYLTFSFKFVQEWEEALIIFLGKYKRTRKAGPTSIFWPFEKVIFVDMRIKEKDMSKQEVITSDGITLEVDAVIWYRADDAKAYTFNIQDPDGSTQDFSMAVIRGKMGRMTEKGCIKERRKITEYLMSEVDGKTKENEAEKPIDWGIKVTGAEIKDIRRPKEVEAAVHKKRAAKDERDATILKAEGESKAKMLMADAERYQVEEEGKADVFFTNLSIEMLEKYTGDKKSAAELYKVLRAINEFGGSDTKTILAEFPGISDLFGKFLK